jgi:hypothetical protein
MDPANLRAVRKMIRLRSGCITGNPVTTTLNMGVTIHTVNDSASVTLPCSSLQEFRGLLMQAYAQHLGSLLQEKYGGRPEFTENENENEYDEIDAIEDDTERENRLREAELKDTLKRLRTEWIKMKNGESRPNYEVLDECYKKRWDLFKQVPGLNGLYKFVVHCDCENYHSVGDCFDILETLTLVQPEFSKLPTLEINQHYFTGFLKVFTDAVQNRTRVDYH